MKKSDWSFVTPTALDKAAREFNTKSLAAHPERVELLTHLTDAIKKTDSIPRALNQIMKEDGAVSALFGFTLGLSVGITTTLNHLQQEKENDDS